MIINICSYRCQCGKIFILLWIINTTKHEYNRRVESNDLVVENRFLITIDIHKTENEDI